MVLVYQSYLTLLGHSIVVQHRVVQGCYVYLDQDDLCLRYIEMIQLELILNDVKDAVKHRCLPALRLRCRSIHRVRYQVLLAALDY